MEDETWEFVGIYQHELMARASIPVMSSDFCPNLLTVLASSGEQVRGQRLVLINDTVKIATLHG